MSLLRPTLRDVAAKAQVSHQTVSRVINHDKTVMPETRTRVEAAITELGYRPNAIARSMVQGRTRTLACLAPNITDYTFAAIVEGASLAARERGYFLLTLSAPEPSDFGTLADNLISQRHADGLIVINPYIDDRHQHLPERIPTVFVGAHPREAHADWVDSVTLDDEAAARTATQYLLASGLQRIGLVTGPTIEDCVTARQVGYTAALQAAGLSFDPDLVLAGDWSASSGAAALRRFALMPNRPQAIFAQNDRMALGVLSAARELNWRVPEELAVIGLDDMPLASYFDPPLTTMRQDMRRIGQESAHLLINALESPTNPRQHVQIAAELIVRRSTLSPQGGVPPATR